MHTIYNPWLEFGQNDIDTPLKQKKKRLDFGDHQPFLKFNHLFETQMIGRSLSAPYLLN